MPESFLETDLWFVSEMFLSASDVSLGMLDIARPGFRVDWSDIVPRDFGDVMKHRIHRDSITAGNIEYLSSDARQLAREQIRFNHVLHVREIT